jgi:hypothetical protein
LPTATRFVKEDLKTGFFDQQMAGGHNTSGRQSLCLSLNVVQQAAQATKIRIVPP